ncbi:MAG: hypothetical protein QM499_01190 [Flavobacteriaceae bacterium]
MQKYFKISGYWNDDKSQFENYIVTDFHSHQHEEIEEEDVFYFGITEKEIKTAIENKEIISDFIITSYQEVKSLNKEQEKDRIKNNYWKWTEEDFKTFEEDGELDHGKWFFYKAKDGKFEAVMSGLYMHIFDTYKDLQMRTNETDFFEFCQETTEQHGETKGVNDKGEIREF